LHKTELFKTTVASEVEPKISQTVHRIMIMKDPKEFVLFDE
jgi:hypothetical protein